jgi:hypothetical protein
MTNQERQTLDQFRKTNNDIGYLRGEHSMWLNPRTRKGFRRRANKAQRRHNRAICKGFSMNWQRLPGCGFALPISQG